MWKLFSKTKILKKDLLSFKDEPLSGLSGFLLIVLDLFIFLNVMMGISGETAKSPKPSLYYPYSCSTHFDAPKTDYSAFGDISHYRQYTFKKELSPYCRDLRLKIGAFSELPLFKERLETIRAIDDKRAKNNSRLEVISKQYNTRLFEQIASMPNNRALRSAGDEYNALHEENKRLALKKEAVPSVTTMKGYRAYRDYVLDNKAAFQEAKKSYTFWQPFKEFGYVLRFVLPLLLLFGFFYYRSKRRELRDEQYNPVVKIISTHISLILILPVIWYTLYIVYHVLPKTLLRQIIDYLISIGLLSILNYLAIAAVVLIFGALIYFIQKRTIEHKKIASKKNIKKVISFSLCPNCSNKVDYARPYCPYCGEELLSACTLCEEMTIKRLPYCQNCGKGV